METPDINLWLLHACGIHMNMLTHNIHTHECMHATHMHIHMQTHMYTYIHMIHTCSRIATHAHIYILVHLHIFMHHTHRYTHMHATHMHTCALPYTQACTHTHKFGSRTSFNLTLHLSFSFKPTSDPVSPFIPSHNPTDTVFPSLLSRTLQSSQLRGTCVEGP